MMDRRHFLKTGTVGTTAVLAACAGKFPEPGWEISGHPADIRLRALQYAILAPSSHNSQPWLVEFTTANGLNLYVDRRRLLPASDPPARQIHISQGAFLELLEIAAREFGSFAEFRYFPDGEYSNHVVEERPVASVTLQPEPTVTPDPLFAEIAKRHTNKRVYELGHPISAGEWAEIQSIPLTAGISWRVVTDEARRKAIAALCTEAMSIEIASRDRNRETAQWFRFSDRELRDKRDGFGMAQSGTEGVKKWFVETFVLSRERAADPEGQFAQGAVTQTREQAESGAAFAALVSKTNSRLDQVLVGRAYARVHLTASRLGLAMQPFSQVLEEYPEMIDLQKRMKRTLNVEEEHTVQMLFRLGHATPTPPAPRRDITTLMRQPAGS